MYQKIIIVSFAGFRMIFTIGDQNTEDTVRFKMCIWFPVKQNVLFEITQNIVS